MKPKKATIKDVAKQAGVSFKTVSRVLNEEENVRSSTREKVILAAQQLGFAPSHVARQFSRGCASTVGIIVLDLPHWSYYSDVIIGVQHECQKHKYTVSVHPIHPNKPEQMQTLQQALSGGALAGLVLTAPWSTDQEFLQLLTSSTSNIACLLTGTESSRYSEIFNKDYDGALALCRYMLKLGHRQFAIAAGPKEMASTAARLAGIQAALAEAGIPADAVDVLFSRVDYESGSNLADSFVSKSPGPTAIIAATDLLAAGIMNRLHEKGYRIPQDISIAGYGDLQIAAQVWPALTTVHQDTQGMASAAAQIVIENAERGNVERAQVYFETSLIVRDSTAPPAPQ